MLMSMTGFGEGHRRQDGTTVAVEVRTINSRYLKVSVRAPEGYTSLESEIEGVVRQAVRRGTVQVNLRVDREASADDFRINDVVLRSYRDQVQKLMTDSNQSEATVLAAILDRDRRGLLVLLDPPHDLWKQTLLERWQRTIGRHVDRIRWMPRMSRDRFLRLLSLADVMLDPLHFGGGNTNYEALGLGLPVVTWPSEFLRGRVALGMYRALGISDCVADSRDDYAARSVAIGNDAELRFEIRRAIRESARLLFDDVAAVRELEDLWASAANH